MTKRSGLKDRLLVNGVLLAGVMLPVVMLASCTTQPTSEDSTPAFHRNLEAVSTPLDVENAAAIISSYRQSQGLNPLKVDQDLVYIAQKHANAQARTNRPGHDVGGSFKTRLKDLQQPRSVAVENVGAGYRSLAQAFSGWRNSKDHNKNMLNPAVTRIGIAKAVNVKSKFKVFWTLILTNEPLSPSS